uniref:Uncharacterized protein n=1 Tax=Lepeophtheirus salmonis TaxID=72036 RepID=A0A0K2UD64_LEPSM
MSGRGRASRATTAAPHSVLSSRGRTSRSASPSTRTWNSVSKRGGRGKAKVKTPPSARRPKFNDNPPAPEIVEKNALAPNPSSIASASPTNGHESSGPDPDLGEDLVHNMRVLLQGKVECVPPNREQHPLFLHLKEQLDNCHVSARDLPSLKSAVSESLSQLKGESISKIPSTLSDAIKELFLSHLCEEESPETLAEEGLSYLKSQFSEATVVPLDQLDHNMVPVESVQIQEYRVQGDPEAKKPSLIDKSKLFSQMEDTFAKDTHQALKNKPVYTKKRELEGHSIAETALDNNKENEKLKNGPSDRFKDSPSPPILTPEMEIRSASANDENPTSYSDTPTPADLAKSLGRVRVNSKRTSESETSCDADSKMDEDISMFPTVLSRADAEMAVMALQFTTNKPSLKTVIRVPPSSSTIPTKKKKSHNRSNKTTLNNSADDELLIDDDHQEQSLIIDEDEDSSPRSSPITPINQSSSMSNANLGVNYSSGKASPDSHKSEEKAGPPESMVVPEKASSFNIHPERCCSDICHYCGLKFGMLDTPLHVSQLKTSEVRKKVEDITGFEKDACLCDKCFRFLDRRAKNSKHGSNDICVNTTNSTMERRKRDESCRKDERKCIVRNCNREVSENVSKKWLVRLKKKLVRKISLDWERVGRGSVKAMFPLCHKHNSWVDFYSSCGLCKKKLTVGGICTLGISKQEVHELNVLLREDRIPAELVENHFVCKLCRTFCNIKQKSVMSPDVFKNQKAHKGFYKDYKKRLYQCLRLDGGENQDNNAEGNLSSSSNGGSKTPKKIHQVSQSDNPTKITIKTTTIPLDDEEVVPTERPSRKRRGGKEVFSGTPSSVKVTESSSCSVNIAFDLNTKKLWQDMHFPYGNYTAFFRHLILLEKFWRNGDLTLSETASDKSSAYIKSVYNRIRAYEGGRSNVKKSSLSSDVDLSASTRPDLSIPAAPLFLHEPYVEEEEDSKVKKDPPYKPPPNKEKQPEILKIPKVPLPSGSRVGSVDNNVHSNDEELGSPPTKIRVRTDLMHLGLIVKPVPNLMKDKLLSSSAVVSVINTNSITTIANSESSVVTSTPSVPNPVSTGAKKMSPHTISSMLNNFPSRLITPTPTPPPPPASSTSVTNLLNESQNSVAAPSTEKSSSNNQLFIKEQSSAIPLTFNNSIAEVLEAANKANKQSSKESIVSMALASKPEITITAKPLPKQQQATIPKVHPSWIQDKAGNKKPSSSTRSPIVDMTKLLQTQNPGLPPHLVAQDHLNTSGSPLKASTNVRPPVANIRMIRPASSSTTLLNPSTSSVLLNNSLVANQQKKSINNILDRLSGLKAVASTSPNPTKNIPPSSSLVQQLQAPPQHLPSPPPRMTGPQQHQQAAAAAAAATAQQLMWAFNPAGGGGSSSSSSSSSNIVGQHMVQYDWLSQTQALMMAGALPTLDQVQAAQRVQAFQELMNLGMGNKSTGNPRMRAPPPLTHMGKGSLPKTKND